jgi:hypothetical protein
MRGTSYVQAESIFSCVDVPFVFIRTRNFLPSQRFSEELNSILACLKWERTSVVACFREYLCNKPLRDIRRTSLLYSDYMDDNQHRTE